MRWRGRQRTVQFSATRWEGLCMEIQSSRDEAANLQEEIDDLYHSWKRLARRKRKDGRFPNDVAQPWPPQWPAQRAWVIGIRMPRGYIRHLQPWPVNQARDTGTRRREIETIRGALAECHEDLEEVLYELEESLTEVGEEDQYEDLKAGLGELLAWGEELAKRGQLAIPTLQE